MKTGLILLFATGLLFLTACNNEPKNATKNKDTSTSQNTNISDSNRTKNGMMKAMEDMMSKVDNMQMSGAFDTDFAKMMIEHHQSAIDMAQIEVSKGTDQKIKAMAQTIIINQKAEQEKLAEITKNDKSAQHIKNNPAQHQLHDGMINMMDKMRRMQMTGKTDKDFVMMMIPHHVNAIEMAKTELSHGKNSQLKEMAQKEITNQTKEITDFKGWLLAN